MSVDGTNRKTISPCFQHCCLVLCLRCCFCFVICTLSRWVEIDNVQTRCSIFISCYQADCKLHCKVDAICQIVQDCSITRSLNDGTKHKLPSTNNFDESAIAFLAGFHWRLSMFWIGNTFIAKSAFPKVARIQLIKVVYTHTTRAQSTADEENKNLSWVIKFKKIKFKHRVPFSDKALKMLLTTKRLWLPIERLSTLRWWCDV